METRKYTQTGTMSMIILVPLFLFFCGMTVQAGVTNASNFMIFLFLSFLLLACCLTFYKITIAVSQTQVSFKMGLGLFGKTYPMSDIRQCLPVNNSVFAGIGIKILANGWLYNVSGYKTIELQFKSKYSVVRIGTDKPEEISEYIQSILAGRYATYGSSERPARRWINPWLGLVLLVVFLVLVVPNWVGIKASCEPDVLKIKGMYSLAIPYTQIEKLDTLSSLPPISLRTNGYAFYKTLIGNFRLSDGREVKMYIRKDSGPVICVQSKGNVPVYIGLGERAKTVELYNQLHDRVR